MLKNEIKKGFNMDKSLIQKYEVSLPNDLVDIWRGYGLGTILDGYLRIIDPEEYQELLDETYFRGKIAVPIMATAFGDIITLEEGQYIGIVKYKNGSFAIITKKFERFMQNLADEYFLQKYFQITQYEEAVEKLGELNIDECYGYVPLLGLGGNEKVDNLRIVKMREHIELISRMVGKIGM